MPNAPAVACVTSHTSLLHKSMIIIFDFDGTIADSFGVIVDVFEKLTKQPHKLTPAEIDGLRDLPLLSVAHRLGVSNWQIPFLLTRGRWKMAGRLREVMPFEGMPAVIEKLHAEGHELLIMSSNSHRNIKKFLKQHHLNNYFVDIKGGVGMFGKPRALRRLLRSNNLKPKDCYYIGDETRDVEAALAVGTRSIAVLWGFARDEKLIELNPTANASSPQDIIRIIEEA
jgi:phosphoglycolate phosphatase